MLGTVEGRLNSASRWPDLIAFYDGGKAWTREEWDIAVSNSLLRIYRANEKSRWYAEGIYD